MPNQEVSYGLDIVGRLRFLERRHENLREKTLIINKNMVDAYRERSEEIREMQQLVKDLKKDVKEVKDALADIVRQMNMFASKEDVKVVEKYMKIWNPLDYITEGEVKKMIERGAKNGKR